MQLIMHEGRTNELQSKLFRHKKPYHYQCTDVMSIDRCESMLVAAYSIVLTLLKPQFKGMPILIISIVFQHIDIGPQL